MKRLGTLALAAALLATTASCGRIKAYFADGRKELEKAFEAKKQARSFRSRTEVSGHAGQKLVTLTEVSCPDRQRTRTTMGETTYESIRAGGAGYVQIAPGQPWQKMPLPEDAVPCGASPGLPAPWAVMSEGSDMLTTLMMMSKGAKIERGPWVETESGGCQQWKMSFAHPGREEQPGSGMSTIICLGSDSLPRQVVVGKSGGVKVTYSDWNQPIRIEPPANAVEMKMEASPHGASPHGMDPHAGIKMK